MIYQVFVTAPKGLEYLLEDECRRLGLNIDRVSPQGVYGEGDLSVVYRLIIWSRIANRVNIVLFSGSAFDSPSIQNLVKQYPWQTVFSANKTFAIRFHGQSKAINNTMYGAQIVKDAIVDYFKLTQNVRPNVDKSSPDISLDVYLKNDMLTVCLDVVGHSLHQRGYRQSAGLAPIKENVAAALLMRAKWPELAEKGYHFYDPLSGSGTIVIEAAMMAANIAPGILADKPKLAHWVGHDASLWAHMRTHALSAIKKPLISLLGQDILPSVIEKAKENANRAGVSRLVQFEVKGLKDMTRPFDKAVVVTNPPYGERLEEMTTVLPIYALLVKRLYQHCQGYEVNMLTNNPMLAKATGLRLPKQYAFYNGAIPCHLYCTTLSEKQHLKGEKSETGVSKGADMFQNRLMKNMQSLKKWKEVNHVEAYRLYDADMPEYAFAIDCYQDYVVLQEYKAPLTIAPHQAEKRRLEVLQTVPKTLEIPHSHMIVKERQAQKGKAQYTKFSKQHKRIVVREGQIQCWVNLTDYVDTGLFLDHRLLRLSFEKLTAGQKFLNLFCYTGVASLHAAKQGAQTVNVDMSKTYLSWAEDNFELNKLPLNRHQFIAMDVKKWLPLTRDKFDVIFLDPPSFSNSKRMEGVLDIQRDHVFLIKDCMRLLKNDGVLYFSTNLSSFKLSSEVSQLFALTDITAKTIDLDFKRNQSIHRCYEIRLMR